MHDPSRTNQELQEENAVLAQEIQELRESESGYKMLFANSSEGILMVEKRTGRFLYANSALCKMFGYSEKEILRLNLQDIHPKDSLKHVLAEFNAMIRGEKTNLQDIPCLRKDGTEFYVNIGGSLIDFQGKQCIAGFFTDITERKHAEETLKIERNRLAGTIEGTRVGTWEWNVQTGETVFNERWAEIIGYTLAEISPVSIETWMKYAHPDDLKQSNEKLEKHFRGELDYYECESRMRHKNGDWVWVLDRGRIVSWTDDGKPHVMMGTHQDITERKQAEEALREREERLQKQNDSLLTLMSRGILFQSNLHKAIAEITEASAALINTERVSVWLYNQDYTEITCIDLYRQSDHHHSSGEKPRSEEFPAYTASHQKGHVIAAVDVYTDSRTSCIPASYYQENGICSLLDAPVWISDRLGALLSFEHVGDQRVWTSEDARLATNMAALLSICFAYNDRKQAEEALQESENQYRILFENAGEAIYVAQDGRVVFGNPMTVTITGYAGEEIASRPFTDFIHVDDRDMVRDRYVRRLKGESIPTRYSFRILPKNGGFRWVELAAVIINWKGRPATLNFMSDITDHKRAEDELRASEEKYRLIFEHSPLGILSFDEKGIIVACNDNFVKIIGSSREKLIGLNMLNLPNAGVVLAVKNALKGRPGFYEGDYSSVTAKKITPVRCLFAPMDSGRRQISGGVGIIEDITDRKNSMDQLRKALGGTVQAIALVVEAKDPYTAGHQRRVADISRAIATEIGLSPDQIDGIRMAGIIHDIGKVTVPAEILSSPRKLTNLEFSLIQTHAQSGYDILKDIEFPWPIARIVLEHHERMNGSGYPKGLTGDDILPESRILAVADVVEAMATHRPYRPALGLDKALEEITQNRGRLYDPDAVDACLRLFREKGYEIKD